MVGYQNQFRPAAVRLAQPLLAQAPGITPGQRNAAIALGAVQTGFGVAATWIGVRSGMREKGLFSVLGYAVAAGGSLITLVNLLGTLGMVTKADLA